MGFRSVGIMGLDVGFEVEVPRESFVASESIAFIAAILVNSAATATTADRTGFRVLIWVGHVYWVNERGGGIVAFGSIVI